MAARVMNELRALLLALPLASCTAAPAEAPPLAGARIGGPFALTDETARGVTDRDYAGKYRIVYFGYTFCPDVCPVDLAQLMGGLKRFEQADSARAARVQPILVSIDPERDTPAVLKEYTDNFHPRLIGLTGTPEAVAAAAKNYAIYFRKEGAPGATDYLVSHSNVAYLMGPDGTPIAPLPHDEGAEAVAASLAKWVQ